MADDFEAFRAAGRRLIDLHVGYEAVEEYPLTCLVDGEPDEGAADGGAYRIDSKMRWGGGRGHTVSGRRAPMRSARSDEHVGERAGRCAIPVEGSAWLRGFVVCAWL